MSTYRKINLAVEEITGYEWCDFPSTVTTTLGRKKYSYEKGCDSYLPRNILLQVYESDIQTAHLRVGSRYWSYVGWQDFYMEERKSSLEDGFYYRLVNYDDIIFTKKWEKLSVEVKTFLGAKRKMTEMLRRGDIGGTPFCFGVVQILQITDGKGLSSVRPTTLAKYGSSNHGSWL